MVGFKTLRGKKIEDLTNYILEYMKQHDSLEIIIGSDSQSYGYKTIYGVVVILYNKGKGAHVLCRRETKPKENNINLRLINEVWSSVEVADILRNNGVTIQFIDIDINNNPRYKSNKVLNQAIGMVEGMGFIPRHKQSGAMATYSANHLVRM